MCNRYTPFFCHRTIISKDETVGNFTNIFQLIIQDYDIVFHYRPASGNVFSLSVSLLQSQRQKLQPNEWHLIIVTVIDVSLSYYIDGELMNINSATLTSPISDPGGHVRIGQNYASKLMWFGCKSG